MRREPFGCRELATPLHQEDLNTVSTVDEAVTETLVAPRPGDPEITPELVADHGLSVEEYERILDLMGRQLTFTELGVFSAMWSEHCGYKNSKRLLRLLPTEAPWVIQGPGENAGQGLQAVRLRRGFRR